MIRRPRKARSGIAALLLIALALAGTLTGCASPFVGVVRAPTALARDAAGLPLGPVSYAEVNKHVEAHLAYPGSTPVSRFGGAEYHHPLSGHDDAAFSGGILATTATPRQIYLWYERWALKHGWHSHDFPSLSTQLSTEGFERGRREFFIVAIDDPQLLGETTGRKIPRGRTIYEIRYAILPTSRIPS